MNKRIWTTLAVAALLGIAMLGLRHIKSLDNQIQLKQIDLKDNSARLKLLDTKYIELNKELEAKDVDKAKVEQQLKDLQIERDKLQADLQAKIKAKEQDIAARAAQAAQATVTPQRAYALSGDCETWKAQAGIASTPATRALINGESGCRPGAVNPSSGACGIPQALPCSKMPCTLQDPVCQLRWMDQYVAARYGSWDNAYGTWLSRSPHWY
jgi:hypothetical protein